MTNEILIGLDRATWGYSISELCEYVDKNRDLGLTGLEIRPEHPELFSEFPDINKNILKTIKDYDFTITIHAPFKDLNIASYNPVIRRASRKFLAKTMDFANHFDEIRYLLFHGGQNSFRSNSKFELKNRKVAMKYTIDTFISFLEKCKEFGFEMAIENMTRSDFRMTSKIIYLKKIFSHPKLQDLYFVFDYSHGLSLSKRYSLRILKKFSDKVISVHIGKDYHEFSKYLQGNPIKVIEPHNFYLEDRIFDDIKDLLIELKNNP